MGVITVGRAMVQRQNAILLEALRSRNYDTVHRLLIPGLLRFPFLRHESSLPFLFMASGGMHSPGEGASWSLGVM